MNNKIAAAKNFVSRHRVALAVVTTSTVCLMIQLRAAKEWNKFLDEHKLTELYYHPEED